MDVKLRNLEYDLKRAIQKVVFGFRGAAELFERVGKPVRLRGVVAAPVPADGVRHRLDLEVAAVGHSEPLRAAPGRRNDGARGDLRRPWLLAEEGQRGRGSASRGGSSAGRAGFVPGWKACIWSPPGRSRSLRAT